MFRNCSGCKVLKNMSHFNRDTRNFGAMGAYCKDCRKKRTKVYRLSGRARTAQLKHNYKITDADYTVLAVKQNGCCAICGRDNPGEKKKWFCVDHCHLTGKVRGLLCHQCNSGIGLLQESPKLLAKAIAYLLAGGV